MSLPPDLRDQLLSGYLDDTLSRDERARVESWLAEDPTAAAELEELRGLQQSLQSLADAVPQQRLEAGFAERVLAAAIKRAEDQGVADDHPLRRVARLERAPQPEPVTRFPLRRAAAGVALAASVMFALLLLRPESAVLPEREPFALAELDPAASETVSPAGKVPAPQSAAPEASDTVAAVHPPQPDLDRAAPPDRPASSDRPASPNQDQPSLPPAATSERALMAESAGAARTSPEAASSSPASTPQVATRIGAILVVEVQLTARGRSEDAVGVAMERAGIATGSRRELSAELIGQLRRQRDTAEPIEDPESNVLYLQAGAKKLDQFYLHLLADHQGIASCGMTLATDVPILDLVTAVSVDPTTIQHVDQAVEFSGSPATVGQLAGELSELPFTPLNREALGGLTTSGRDVPAQILLLVR